MNIRPVSEWTLYKFRFAIGYCFLAIIIALYILLYGNLIPPGLGPSEKQSIINASRLSFDQLPTAIIDLPYYLTQKFSIDFFGVSQLGVRLPSIIFGSLTALFTILILRRWLPYNVALITGLVMFTSAWFIGLSRLGAPFIMLAFWTSLTLLAATYISQQTPNWKRWKIVLAFAAALSLYTPFTIYFFVAAVVASFAQPHLRYLIRQSSRFHITLGTLLFLLILVPLGWGLYKDPSQAWALLAIPADLPDPLQFGRDLLHAISTLINPYSIGFGEVLTPLISLAVGVFFVVGSIRLLRDYHAVRSYALLLWLAILIPVIGFNPGNLTVLLVPIALIVGIGIQPVLLYWYKLFPLNPYARIFGLIPIGILLLSLVQFNDQRYTFGMLYSQGAKETFSDDVFLAEAELSKIEAGKPAVLVVPEDDRAVYNLVADKRPETRVLSPSQVTLSNGTWIVAEDQLPQMAVLPAELPTKLLVNDDKDKALRFRVFER